MKVILAVAAAMSIVALAWGGGILYWHLKLSATIRSLQSGTVPQTDFVKGGYVGDYYIPMQVLLDLRNSGCRALPYLVGSLDPSRPTHVLSATASQIRSIMEESQRDPSWHDLRPLMDISVHDPPQTVRAKCLMIREWWGLNGHKHHQGWGFGSADCAAARFP